MPKTLKNKYDKKLTYEKLLHFKNGYSKIF